MPSSSASATRPSARSTRSRRRTASGPIKELRRQFDSSLYERLALSRNKEAVRALATVGQVVEKPSDLFKEPLVLEFLGMDERPSSSNPELESGIIDKLEHFPLELWKGFLFEGRQRRFTFDDEYFFIDLVFYNQLLRWFVLVDLKIGKLTHEDLGQMQMYVNFYDRNVKLPEERPTIGIIERANCRTVLLERRLRAALTRINDHHCFALQEPLVNTVDARDFAIFVGDQARPVKAPPADWRARRRSQHQSRKNRIGFHQPHLSCYPRRQWICQAAPSPWSKI